ncbi:VOC family protein [Enterovibrio coralii]|uniref:Glyoxalase n=1 Tax=Enterovibrio coralii TaxID=294935 RepID=A0A135IAX6_9GAMM|nr:VOC family protein [Enterovibrio coralii]KXF82623.1 glyoxalase [Enterovibrio coralii]
MLNHVSVGTSDLQSAMRFYDAVMETLSVSRTHTIEGVAAAYGAQFEFWVGLPYAGKASAGNGVHIALTAPSKEAVNAFHQAAIEQGGKCDGAPGYRAEYGDGYYAAYIKDLDGNKIEAVCLVIG